MGFLDRFRGIPETLGPPPAASAPPHTSATGAWFDLGSLPQPDADVLAALEAGGVVRAVKAYREQSGAGLAEAKHVIDAMVRGDRLIGASEAPHPGAPEREEGRGADAYAHIDRLILEGQLIAAIKAYREQSGEGLKEAKDAVEARRDALGRGKG